MTEVTAVERQTLAPGLKFAIWRRDEFRCTYCGVHVSEAGVVLEVDHVVPVILGGTNSFDNLVTACRPCNRGKADGPAEDMALPRQLWSPEHYALASSRLRARVDQIECEAAELEWEWKYRYPSAFNSAGGETDFALGASQRVTVRVAVNDDWVTNLQLKYQNVNRVQQRYLQAQAEHSRLQPYLAQGMTTEQAVAAYLVAHPTPVQAI